MSLELLWPALFCYCTFSMVTSWVMSCGNEAAERHHLPLWLTTSLGIAWPFAWLLLVIGYIKTRSER